MNNALFSNIEFSSKKYKNMKWAKTASMIYTFLCLNKFSSHSHSREIAADWENQKM